MQESCQKTNKINGLRENSALRSRIQVYIWCVQEHFAGRRISHTLGTVALKVNLGSVEPIADQISSLAIDAFRFLKYSERIRIVRALLPLPPANEDRLSCVKKHVEIRNSIQHHGSRVNAGMLRNLGNVVVPITQQDGTTRDYRDGERINLTLTELSRLKGNMFVISNAWLNP
jgi:hypothetical protein